MSRRKRRGDSTAPALFPFLAVLLCTIGALILILAITVTNTHASAKRDVEQALVDVKESTNIAEIVSEELDIQREHLKTNIDRRRRDLADIEDHIDRLKKSLEQLVDQLNRIESQSEDAETSKTDKANKIADLKKEIDERKKTILEEIEKQKKRKPAFAIIPYSGNSGTTRRPVYLECTKAGIVIQPEGLMISASELRPPLGPGNALDSALRVLRNAYQQKDATFGITQPPYPLLLVRPDGIQSYALAREAMSGWDDQFGYELIGADMELKFPPSMPGLREQLASTIDLAKKRQIAFLASIPRNARIAERDSWDSIDSANASNSTQGLHGGGQGSQDGLTSTQADSQNVGSDWKLVQGLANAQVTGTIQKNAGSSQMGTGNGFENGSLPPALGAELTNPNGDFVLGGPPSAPSNGGTGRTNGAKNERASQAEFQGGNSAHGPESAGSNNTSSTPGGSANPGTQVSGGNASGNAAGGSQFASSSQAPNAAAAGMIGGSATGTPLHDSSPSAMQSNATQSSEKQTSERPNGVSVNLNSPATPPNKAKYVNPDGDLKPISVSAGKGWAASRAEGKATPVSRQIFLVALKDRWLLRSESEPNAFDANITMDEGPQQAGNQLASAIRARVDSWGLSLPGGYWAPSLTIESASDAQQSVMRLQTLLEGSGIELQVVPLKLPNRR